MDAPKIQQLKAKKLIGVRIQTTLEANETGRLWYSFRSRQKEVSHQIGTDLYSVQLYPSEMQKGTFTPQTFFEKWAAVEVGEVSKIPKGMAQLDIQTGLYAVFIYKGVTANFYKAAQYIFGVWLPQSDYKLDARPHFECMGQKYLYNDPNSEEEVWIPIQPK